MVNLEFKNKAEKDKWLEDNLFPKTGDNAATGKPAPDKQKTERPVPIIESKIGSKFLMEGVEEKHVKTAKRVTEVTRADWNFPEKLVSP